MNRYVIINHGLFLWKRSNQRNKSTDTWHLLFSMARDQPRKKIALTCYKGILRMNGPCLNPLCSCSLEIEDTMHYLLHCQHFSNHCYDLMNSVKSIIPNFESLTDNNRIDIPYMVAHDLMNTKIKFFGSNNKLLKKF